MSVPNVSGKRPRPTRTAYLDAVAKIIRDIKAAHGLSNVKLAERIGAEDDSVHNWENGLTAMDPVKLALIEDEFGSGSIDPFLALAGSHSCPIDFGTDDHDDLLPLLSAAIMMIATARSPQSPGGIAETHGELLAMETILLDARRGINRRLARIAHIRGC